MWKKVDDYALNFHNTPRRYTIHVKMEDGSDAVVEHLSVEEFNALGCLLRSEKQIWYHSTRGDISAHSAPQHEEGIDY